MSPPRLIIDIHCCVFCLNFVCVHVCMYVTMQVHVPYKGDERLRGEKKRGEMGDRVMH